ncbi:MAG: hypothetical protein M3Z05_03400 [Gemmatimonadota bacterium]|nr:hypothetical protein [Gemmatimonadota bacterium]
MRRRYLALAVLATATLNGCSQDATAPLPPLELKLSLTGVPSSVVSEFEGRLKIDCATGISLSAAGTGRAMINGGVLRYFFGANRVTPADSQLVTVADQLSSFGDTLSAGTKHDTFWRFSGSAPFDVELELRAVSTTSTLGAPARVRLSCGPVPASATTPPPTVTDLSVTPTNGEMQPGDTISVKYAASALSPLWSTRIILSGPFTLEKEIPESGSSTARTVKLVVPYASSATPLSVRVIAYDAGLRSTSRVLLTEVTVVDRTPPAIPVVQLLNQVGGRIAGQYGAGDVLQFLVNAYDNAGVKTVVWTVGAPANVRDSVVVAGSPTSWSGVIDIRTNDSWVGTPAISFAVRDVSGLTSSAVTSPQKELSFYPVVDRPATLPLAVTLSGSLVADLGDIVYDAKRGLAYVGVSGGPIIAVLDVATMSWKPPIPLAAAASSFDLTPDGDTLVAALPSTRSLAVVDLRAPSTPIRTIALSVLDTAGAEYQSPAPEHLAISATGQVLVALSARTRSLDRYVVVNLVTGAQRIRTDGRTISGFPTRDVRATPDRSRIFIGDFDCPRWYFASTDAFGPCQSMPELFTNFARASFNAAGDRFAWGNGVLDLSLRALVVSESIVGYIPTGALSPDGASVWLAAGRSVSRMRVSDGVILDRTRLPLIAGRLFPTPDGAYLLVFQAQGNPASVSRIDLR